YKKEYSSRQDSLRVMVRAASAARIHESVDEVRQIMRGRHHLSYGAKDDFALETSDSFLALWKNISSTFFFVTIAIASISLVVGGAVRRAVLVRAGRFAGGADCRAVLRNVSGVEGGAARPSGRAAIGIEGCEQWRRSANP